MWWLWKEWAVKSTTVLDPREFLHPTLETLWELDMQHFSKDVAVVMFLEKTCADA